MSRDPQRPRRMRPVGSLIVIAVLLAGALGLVAGSIFVPWQRPEALQPGPSVQAVAPQRVTFDDARNVAFTPVRRASSELAAPRDGIVTSTSCKVGASLSSGDVPATIDGNPVIALWTSYPLFRNLEQSTKGEDVAAVQAELARLGYAPGTGGTWGAASMAAWRAFQLDRGIAKPAGELDRGLLLALPAKKVTVASCPAPVGAAVTAGGPLVTLGGQVTSLKLAAEVQGAAPGERVVRHGEHAAAVGKDGTVTDAEFLTALAASAQYKAWTESKGESPLTLGYALAKPVEALVVPAAALFSVSGPEACLLADGAPTKVTILTSKLGSTYVATKAQPSRVTIPAAEDRAGSARCG